VKKLDSKEIASLMQKCIPSQCIKFSEPMNKHTSFKVGGPADVFITPQNTKQLLFAINSCKEQGIPFYIMGNGSNLLVRDKGYRGVIIQVYKNISQVKIEGEYVWAEAGVLLSSLANRLLNENLSGFEFASGIPGTLGGAIYMNAGAYGGEMKQIVRAATVLDEKGKQKVLDVDELSLGYRTSVIQKKGYTVLSARLKLKKGNKEEIGRKIQELTVQRVTKQPLEMPSAGSTFKRPQGYYAGKLILDSGLRGSTIAGAQVSEKHCGFVVNRGNATAKDILHLIAHIQSTVKEKFNVDMEPEVRVIGEV
jgi:UDP-N-acetylmuramate dehydrogenase